ncbi:MAG: DUF4202 domain-containing protein [Flavisolibacter sp.]
MSRIDQAFLLFDEYNQQDPHMILWDDIKYPAEYFYALQLYNWVLKLYPDANETLLLAARSQHIGRWKIPRETYPDGKAGYLSWRSDMAKFHANIAGDLLIQAGYHEEEIKKLQQILLKENLKNDAEVQVMENALCLVFLQFQYEDFIQKYDEEKIVRILQKSWKKMTEPGRNFAMTLEYSAKGRQLLENAINKY